MKKFLAVSLLILISMVFVPGCTLPDTAGQNQFRTLHSWDIDSKMLVEDFNETLMLDRPSHLSYWYVHFGNY